MHVRPGVNAAARPAKRQSSSSVASRRCWLSMAAARSTRSPLPSSPPSRCCSSATRAAMRRTTADSDGRGGIASAGSVIGSDQSAGPVGSDQAWRGAGSLSRTCTVGDRTQLLHFGLHLALEVPIRLFGCNVQLFWLHDIIEHIYEVRYNNVTRGALTSSASASSSAATISSISGATAGSRFFSCNSSVDG